MSTIRESIIRLSTLTSLNGEKHTEICNCLSSKPWLPDGMHLRSSVTMKMEVFSKMQSASDDQTLPNTRDFCAGAALGSNLLNCQLGLNYHFLPSGKRLHSELENHYL